MALLRMYAHDKTWWGITNTDKTEVIGPYVQSLLEVCADLVWIGVTKTDMLK